jgi:hypothetical protein
MARARKSRRVQYCFIGAKGLRPTTDEVEFGPGPVGEFQVAVVLNNFKKKNVQLVADGPEDVDTRFQLEVRVLTRDLSREAESVAVTSLTSASASASASASSSAADVALAAVAKRYFGSTTRGIISIDMRGVLMATTSGNKCFVTMVEITEEVADVISGSEVGQIEEDVRDVDDGNEE